MPVEMPPIKVPIEPLEVLSGGMAMGAHLAKEIYSSLPGWVMLMLAIVALVTACENAWRFLRPIVRTPISKQRRRRGAAHSRL